MAFLPPFRHSELAINIGEPAGEGVTGFGDDPEGPDDVGTKRAPLSGSETDSYNHMTHSLPGLFMSSIESHRIGEPHNPALYV